MVDRTTLVFAPAPAPDLAVAHIPATAPVHIPAPALATVPAPVHITAPAPAFAPAHFPVKICKGSTLKRGQHFQVLIIFIGLTFLGGQKYQS